MSLDNQTVEQAVIIRKSSMSKNQLSTKFALFNEDGSPVDFGGGGGGSTDWIALTNKPEFIAAGDTAAAARDAIGAGTGNGTSNLVIGTTSSTAKAGDYQPTAANISDATTVGRALVTASDAAAARDAIGAGTGNGTSNLVIATTAPAPLAAEAAVGTGTTAARADHAHVRPTVAEVTGLQSIIADLTARIVALEGGGA